MKTPRAGQGYGARKGHAEAAQANGSRTRPRRREPKDIAEHVQAVGAFLRAARGGR